MNTYITKLRVLLFLAACVTTHAGAANLSVENAWIAEAPPVSKVMAAYMDIRNTGDTHFHIVSAESDDFGSIEFHKTVYKNGMASMQHQSELMIDGHSTMKLEPGSYHMMLFNPVKSLRAGDTSVLRLQLLEEGSVSITVTVKKASPDQAHEHHH